MLFEEANELIRLTPKYVLQRLNTYDIDKEYVTR